MPSETKIYTIKSFLRKNESGYLSRDRVREIINDLVRAAIVHPRHNILLDFRETRISDVSMLEIMETAMTLEKFKGVLANKIANIVPDDVDRVAIAKKTEAAIRIKGFDYRAFTDFEQALDWLSEIAAESQPEPS